MSADFRKTATCRALISCIVRHLQKQRSALVAQIPEESGPITEETRPLSAWIDQIDHALSDLSRAEDRERGA